MLWGRIDKEAFTTPLSHTVVCVTLQGRVCDGSQEVTGGGTGVSPGAVRSVGVRLEESASSAGAVEPTRGPPHIQQPLLCAAELEHPQVTDTAHFTC